MNLEDDKKHYEKTNSKTTNKIKQKRYTFIMTPNASKSITIYISPDVTTDWQVAFSQAN
jgi:hypothetical protein